ncbi:hypothetical protein BOTBODRAFT_146754 [Botryobasidium botryosum FD-172 SS1]|uniref:Uncharacterized protein n=1 Tax=Botryobasidium botryosum (strain FD-172 SS1) TaxID=930990 RepID=A0A067M938_BOTB1|nr:hypothetical protein BOTBODRAFT_146754 [Botryobasidium botryosum FD-172 SS1]
MTNKRRPSTDTPRTTRASKAAKVAASPSKSPTKRRGKAVLAPSKFKTRAQPLHLNLTHTEPSAELAAQSEDAPSSHPNDPGHIATFSLVPTDFATGSYGWKGQRRLTIELPAAEGEEKEKVQVMININATVLGSKAAKDDPNEEDSGAAEEAEKEEANGEKKEEEAVDQKAEKKKEEEVAEVPAEATAENMSVDGQ